MAAAIAAALYAKRAAVATEDTVNIARAAADDAGNALTIAGRNADAAVKLADQAETTAERQLRAYLSISSVVFYDSFAGRDEPQLVISLKNHGQTPATLIRKNVGASWFVSAGNVEEIFNHDYAVESDIFPDATLSVPVLMPRDISNGDEDGLIFVIGRIDYRDVFGNEHILPFQYQTFFKKPYVDVEHEESLVVRPFDYSPKKGSEKKS
ncbi:MAG: hypothetical protein ACO1NN_09415 [Sphingopyxis sp.]